MKNLDSQINSFIDLSEDDLKNLYNYPNLGKIFDTKEGLEYMRQKLQKTYEDYERVVIQGNKEDAEMAKNAAQSIKTTLNLLVNIEEALLKLSEDKL